MLVEAGLLVFAPPASPPELPSLLQPTTAPASRPNSTIKDNVLFIVAVTFIKSPESTSTFFTCFPRSPIASPDGSNPSRTRDRRNEIPARRFAAGQAARPDRAASNPLPQS